MFLTEKLGTMADRWISFNLIISLLLTAGASHFNITQLTQKSHKTLPKTQNGEPFEVLVGFYATSLGNIEATRMAFDIDMYLRLSWQDPRLSHKQDSMTINDLDILSHLWVPDIYFGNAKSAHFQHVTVPNFVLFIENDGTCSYSTRVTAQVACNLKLINYPLDSQICKLEIQTYAHPLDQMNVSWFSKSPITINENIDLAEFEITGSEAAYCSGQFEYAMTHKGSRTGEFSCLEGRIYLQRAIGFHLVQTYIPTGLIVVISWVSFWIDPSAAPARVSLTFTTLLTLSTMGAGIRYSLPPVSYAKAIDYWFGMCMLFIFGSLLEFALINSLMRRDAKDKAEAAEKRERSESIHVYLVPSINRNRKKKKVIDYSAKALCVDKWCRLIFPLMFLIFNFGYWGYYCHLA